MQNPTNHSAKLILHPTDFSSESEIAFDHALRIAIHNKATLYLLHVLDQADEPENWDAFPQVRQTLERWGLLGPGSKQHEVIGKLGVEIHKVSSRSSDVVNTILTFPQVNDVDLIVLGTHGREGWHRWLHPSIAEPVARASHIPTLFVPCQSSGFVSRESGQVRLREVLIPIDHHPDLQPALERATNIVNALGGSDSTITIFHAGKDMPTVTIPNDSLGKWRMVLRDGRAAHEIAKVAEELDPDLITMVTAGHQGFLDALRGSTTEQIVRKSSSPLLAIPA